MLRLRISDVPASAGGLARRVAVEWQDDGAAPRAAVAELSGITDRVDGELVRWYLEDFAEFPADPAPKLATTAEQSLAQDGTDLFVRIFSSRDAVGIWERARDRLDLVRVEVDVDPGEGPGLAWELLRDPDRDAPLALAAGAFVRTHLQAAGHPDLPVASGDRLRVLLVICRPGGREDVPFRSVASRLVRRGAGHMDGLDLDLLRPPTFAQLSQVLRAAKASGRPYHVVHFDGHGDYLDAAASGASVAGPVRAGTHGYLLFEDPSRSENLQLVDGLTLGRLLASTGVPVLVMNACRSAYAEARDQPAAADRRDAAPQDDVHARIQAYGSLAAEVADVGVPGVVAMRYNVYVVTAAQFVADLYAHLLAGRSLGEAATAARRALADDPNRRIGTVSVSLQDWAVPLVYESAPLILLQPPADRAAPLIKLSAADEAWDQGSAAGLPAPPDAGFFGRDETVLALDRAFDAQGLVLLHEFAGAGKTATAAEFARWYQATGGLDHPGFLERGPGPVLWSSFEHYLTAEQLISFAGGHFVQLIAANGLQWTAIRDPAQRRDIVLQILKQVPVLWVWDNVEPVTGFPAGSASSWTRAEQRELADLLRDIGQTKCKVLLTSRRDEQSWLGNLPTRIRLPSMPMRESLQLAAAIAAKRNRWIAGADWRPLLRFAGGNPLTITVVISQALRENLASAAEITIFLERLQTGIARFDTGQDGALGRTSSLAASLEYGFDHTFTEIERAQLALLHLFRGTVQKILLRYMGDPDVCGEDTVPQIAGLERDAAAALLARAADVGLLASLNADYYQIHPALPWFFAAMFASAYGSPGEDSAAQAARAYAKAMGVLGRHRLAQHDSGSSGRAVSSLRVDEANLLHGLECARTHRLWDPEIGCMQGLKVLYERTGRDSEWSRLLADIATDFTDQASDGPLPGRDEQWHIVTTHRARLAEDHRDWRTATALKAAIVDWSRDRAAEALTIDSADLTPGQRNRLRDFAIALADIGDVRRKQGDPGCVPPYQEALALDERIGDGTGQGVVAHDLGLAYLSVPALRDLDQAERWFRHGLEKLPAGDTYRRVTVMSSLGQVAIARFEDARTAGENQSVLRQHLNLALMTYTECLDLLPADAHSLRGVVENELGTIYQATGNLAEALNHYQRSLHHKEARGERFRAGSTRKNIALLLAQHGLTNDAMQYALAALENFHSLGPSAAAAAAEVQQLVDKLRQASR